MLLSSALLFLLSLPLHTLQQKIVLTNDDGWAVAQIRAEYTALKAAGYDVKHPIAALSVLELRLVLNIGCAICPGR